MEPIQHPETLFASPARSAELREWALDMPSISLNPRQLCDLELLATGVFQPLQGYMNRAGHELVLDGMRLSSGELWPLPIGLDMAEDQAVKLDGLPAAALRDEEGYMLAVLHISDIWPADRAREALALFGTEDPSHPGVQRWRESMGAYWAGGRLEVVSRPIHYDFLELRRTPGMVSETIRSMGWNRVLAFITGNPIHQPQHALTLAAMDRMEAGLLLLPLAGLGCPRDIHYYTRTRCYQAVRPYYPPDRFLISLLPWSTRLAGAREALMQALMARNYGATDFIVRPGEEGLEKNGSGLASAEADQVWDVLKRHEKEIGLELEYIPQGRTSGRKKPTAPVTPSETGPSFLTSDDLLDRIRRGREVPSWASFPEVIQELEKDYPPPHRQGFTLFFTGLSGAGKSTLAKILYAKFLELGDRPVTLLDGDIVRRHLSSDLGFSKEDRDKNIRRIGFVASEITKNRGIAICAPIAPYARTRNEIRDQVEQYGGFFEIWVSTPLDVCEKRDRKGMYAKARKGLIKGFTGIDDPYEIPEAAELTIDTSEVSPEAAVADILARLAVTGFIRLPGTIDGEACR